MSHVSDCYHQAMFLYIQFQFRSKWGESLQKKLPLWHPISQSNFRSCRIAFHCRAKIMKSFAYLIFGGHCCKLVCMSFSGSGQTRKPIFWQYEQRKWKWNGKPKTKFCFLAKTFFKRADRVNKNAKKTDPPNCSTAQRKKIARKIVRNVRCLQPSKVFVGTCRIDLHARR